MFTNMPFSTVATEAVTTPEAVRLVARAVPVSVGASDSTVEPVPVEVVTPVPPFATARVPAKAMAPVVTPDGVRPVVPPEKLDTPPVLVAHVGTPLTTVST